MRRDLAGHADRDALAAVHQQIRNARRQNFGFDFAVVVIGAEIDGFLVDIVQQFSRDARQPRFGVPHGRRRIAVDGSEIPLAVHQRIAQGERLRHADQRVIHRNVAVRMVFAQHIADDVGAFPGGAIGVQPHRIHAVKDAPVHGLQAVAHVGQGAADDHAHGVIEIRPPHLVFDIDGNQVLRAAVPSERYLTAWWWNGGVLRICQTMLLINDCEWARERAG